MKPSGKIMIVKTYDENGKLIYFINDQPTYQEKLNEGLSLPEAVEATYPDREFVMEISHDKTVDKYFESAYLIDVAAEDGEHDRVAWNNYYKAKKEILNNYGLTE